MSVFLTYGGPIFGHKRLKCTRVWSWFFFIFYELSGYWWFHRWENHIQNVHRDLANFLCDFTDGTTRIIPSSRGCSLQDVAHLTFQYLLSVAEIRHLWWVVAITTEDIATTMVYDRVFVRKSQHYVYRKRKYKGYWQKISTMWDLKIRQIR